MFTTSLSNIMTTISGILGKLFGADKSKDKPVLTQATKLEAAYDSVKRMDTRKKYQMAFRKADSYELEALASTLPEFLEYLESYLELLKDGTGIRFTDLRGRAMKTSLTDFLTQDNHYVPLSCMTLFYKMSNELLDILYEHKDKETGKESHYIRLLGNTLVSIKNISDAFIACSDPRK